MSEPLPGNDPQSVWQKQQLEGIRMSADEICRRATAYQRRILWRNAREYVGALATVVFFGFQFWWTTDTATRAGFVLIGAGLLYIVWQLWTKGASRSVPAEMGLSSALEFHRRELERQRDLVRSVWRWYLAPLIPGWVVLSIGLARTNPGHIRHFALVFTIFQIVAASAFIFVWWLNQRAARRLQGRIDELDALASSD
jgi:hypothetical protein